MRWFAARNDLPALSHIREVRSLLKFLRECHGTLVRASALAAPVRPPGESPRPNPWTEFLVRVLEAWRLESDNAELPAQSALEFVSEACAEAARDFSYGEGVTLSTVHAAKGTEHDHVLLLGAVAREFKAGRFPVLLAGVECMAEGHSFHRCRNVVLMAYSWAYDKFEQAINRIHRLNSTGPVNVYPLI